MRFRPGLLQVAVILGLAAGLGFAAARAADDMMAKPEDGMAMPAGNTEIATFAGGCFWCMQPPYDATKGVIKTVAGYTGGTLKDPTYHQVSDGGTGHAESVEVYYDPSVVSYQELLTIFWHNIDPLVKDQQFCDHGNQYRTAIFYHGAEQKKLAEESKAKLEASGKFQSPIQTEIVEAGTFYPAEDYHQEYYKKNPLRYKYYRWNCGRDQRLKYLWGDEAPEAHHD